MDDIKPASQLQIIAMRAVRKAVAQLESLNISSRANLTVYIRGSKVIVSITEAQVAEETVN